MKIGLLPDAVKPGIHCARTPWIRGSWRTAGLARADRDADGAAVTWVRFLEMGRTGAGPRGGRLGRTGVTAGWWAGDGRGVGGWDGWCRGREGGCLVTLIHSGLLTKGRATEW
jgi:hypothetical protein